jgi:hypothetical protein
VWYPLNTLVVSGESTDANKIYCHHDTNHPDVCDVTKTKWVGKLWNNGLAAPALPGYYGTAWASPGAIKDGCSVGGAGCLYFSGEQGGRVQCGTTYGDCNLGIGAHPGDINAITLSCWVKWLGLRTWDPYLMSKGEGLMGKRTGYSENEMIWTFWESESTPGAFGFGHYASGDIATPDLVCDGGLLDPFIGRWVHVAATFPHPSGDPADANSHAKLYLNGGEVDDGPWRFSHGYDPNIFLTIGQTNDQNGWPDSPATWYGYIDEVRIYNRALGPNEIAYLADPSPEDGQLWIPISSPANVTDVNEIYPYEGTQPQGKRSVNFRDYAMVANVDRWLTEEMFPLPDSLVGQ